MTHPLILWTDETTDIGNDYGMPVSTEYTGASKYNGRIDVVQIDAGDDDDTHVIDPEQIARNLSAMTRVLDRVGKDNVRWQPRCRTW